MYNLLQGLVAETMSLVAEVDKSDVRIEHTSELTLVRMPVSLKVSRVCVRARDTRTHTRTHTHTHTHTYTYTRTHVCAL